MGNGHAVLENRDPKFALRVDIIGSDAPYGKPWSEPILKLYHEPGSKFSDPVQLGAADFLQKLAAVGAHCHGNIGDLLFSLLSSYYNHLHYITGVRV